MAGRTKRPIRPTKSPGTLAMVRARKSLICVLAMSTAIPLVNPTITGRGMYFTVAPRPVIPNISRITPAINVQTHKPSTPYFATMP